MMSSLLSDAELCHSYPADGQFLAAFPVLSHGNMFAVIQSASNNNAGNILTPTTASGIVRENDFSWE